MCFSDIESIVVGYQYYRIGIDTLPSVASTSRSSKCIKYRVDWLSFAWYKECPRSKVQKIL